MKKKFTIIIYALLLATITIASSNKKQKKISNKQIKRRIHANATFRKLSKTPKMKEAGNLSGVILQIIDSKSLLLVSEEYGQVYYVGNGNTKSLIDGQKLNIYVIRTGTYKYESISKASKSIAKLTYIGKAIPEKKEKPKNRRLYTRKCSKCRGRGKVSNKDSSSNVSRPYIKCRKCRGRGIISYN